ncbi:MAG TPA: hypothetical protein VID04_13615 [Methylomirabilota bacterium]
MARPPIPCFEELRRSGTVRWMSETRSWIGEPVAIVAVLARSGFAEYKHELARCGSRVSPVGGVWQGLDARTGAVASAVWVRSSPSGPAIVYLDIDGTRFTGPEEQEKAGPP